MKYALGECVRNLLHHQGEALLHLWPRTGWAIENGGGERRKGTKTKPGKTPAFKSPSERIQQPEQVAKRPADEMSLERKGASYVGTLRGMPSFWEFEEEFWNKIIQPAPLQMRYVHVSQTQEAGTNQDGTWDLLLPALREQPTLTLFSLRVREWEWACLDSSPLWGFLWSKLWKRKYIYIFFFFPMKVKKMCILRRPLLFLELTSVWWTPQLTCGGHSVPRSTKQRGPECTEIGNAMHYSTGLQRRGKWILFRAVACGTWM